jgi:hypothetical protein
VSDDTRFRRWAAGFDDLRTEVADVEENEGPPLKLRRQLAQLHDLLNAAIRLTHQMQGKCSVCGGAEKVMRADGSPAEGFNWALGELISCPACSAIGVS